ncbi:ImmA/IrrE family metallo-endopeptidase [Microbacterium sp. MYb64]|uniref:ImmA/IrrE family metallo-endopeptidase n=1 Tax=Microbacterium sp. MYb64 TaxID=1848691 RepID=UPI0015E2C82C|nr:ImmA/IrrE family metallo-endopeptidase [Microbacterium sp. MYb64]
MLDAFGIEIEYCDVPSDRDADTDVEARHMRVQWDLRPRTHRCTIVHELAHVVFGDVPSMFGPVNAKQERRADEWAAKFLIDLDDFRRAEEVCLGRTESMAVALFVTTDLVEAFRRLLFRVNSTVYVEPKMGAGQWASRVRVS